ncbi:MAG: T9SS type A sorting domain-containing protein [Dysgonamonadaceae bacterium]|jgi:hypothetical protein|nr:T9SS type A sorting domain-containing protein [Dysgonamonadaceae bacterium]
MKRTFLLLLVFALCTLTSYAQQANIYASGLKAEKVDGTHYTFGYTLNADATSGSIEIITGATIVNKSITDPGALTKGAHSVTLDLSDLASGQYAWSITVAAAANEATAPVKVSNDAEHLGFRALRGITVDNSFESPFFGRVYATEGNEATASTTIRATNDGIYIYNAALEDVTGQGATAYAGGVTWGLTGSGGNSGASPFRVVVAPDGQVFITDWSDSHTGIWILDPANPSANLKPVFGGTRNATGVASQDGVGIHGSIAHCYIEGTGADTKLYTFDEDLGIPSGIAGNIYRYDIGVLENPWTAAPSALIYDDVTNNNLQQNGNSCIAPDGRGGWWICQNRAIGTETDIPPLIHYNGTSVDFISSIDAVGLLANTSQGGMALNDDKTMMVLTGNGAVRVLDIAFDDAGKPSLALKYEIATPYGTNSYSVALDNANNVYVGGNISAFSVYALPKANNTFTTPAPSASVLTIENTPPAPEVQLTTQYTKTDYTWNTGNASRDAAVYDGKVYAIDNSGKIHVIDGATGEEDASGLITNAALNCFGISSDGAGQLYVPTGNTAGGSNFSISTVDVLNANAVTTLTYADESGTVGSGKRCDYIEVYKVDGTATYIAGTSTNATPHLRIWSTDGTTVTTPIVSADINYKDDGTTNNNNTGGDITWIDATHLITTGQTNIPRYVTIDPVAGTATQEPIGTATTSFGGSAYFVLKGTPYLVLTDGGLGAIKVFDITDKTAPVEVASAPAIGSVANTSVHVGIDAFVSGDVATIYVWVPNNGLAVHKLAEGPVGIPAVEVAPAVTISVKAYELEVQTAGGHLAGYALYGIDGRLVRSAKTNGTSATIAIGHLPQGVYVLQVTTSTGVVAKKFMKR